MMMMNAVPFGKGKIMFQVFLIIVFQWTSITCPTNLYNTDRTAGSNLLQFDCLNYHIERKKWVRQELFDVVDDIIPYCRRPSNYSKEAFEVSAHLFGKHISFEAMRMTNITTQQLLSWSISIEVAERYESYLTAPNASLNEYFFNCTEPHFGVYCQYSFGMGEAISFDQIIETDFRERREYPKLSGLMVQVPCYILLSCHRNGQFWCLDWREVCDGKIDCFDEGHDEDSCISMEINECSEDEFRCHNGLCISEDLWEDGLGDADCLDRSDTATDIIYGYINFCFQDPTFRCEEQSCRVDGNVFFSCGDGQCVSKFMECHNGRHMLLIESMSAKGNLTDECWIAMVCLTELVVKDNSNFCDLLQTNDTAYEFLKTCDSIFQFPTVPVDSHHIRFFYENPHLKLDENQLLLPDYFCYDHQLCDSIKPEYTDNNLTCLNKTGSIIRWNIETYIWMELMTLIEGDFFSCLVFRDMLSDETNYGNYSALYKCQNSRKFISKHRILDSLPDCYDFDDELYTNSCLLNDRYREICYDKTKCWSPLVKMKACQLNLFEDSARISFQSFCDGIERNFYDKNGTEHNDEEICDNWLCDNIYTRCDGFPACSDKRDESNCEQIICPLQTYPCINPTNYTMFCLPYASVKDGTADCLGALDEQSDCRILFHGTETSHPFNCSNTHRCLPVSKLCDKSVDCPEDDDEKFCENQHVICDHDSTYNGSDVEKVVCALNEYENRRIKYFSLRTCANYPLLDNNAVSDFDHWPKQHSPINNGNVSQMKDNLWPWYCNRGHVMHISIQNNSINRTCICPPSYYGDSCQYQNQRISLTLRLSSNERQAIYAIVSMLINGDDERQEIDAYDQSVYITKQSCSIKLNRYLLFSTRPKNISRNYSVRIDVYEKSLITYVGSWHFPISFLFLPVNRLSVSLNLSNHLLQRASNCSPTCKNGECIKYVNKEIYFCQCNLGWSGIQCNMPVNCHACSLSSICIGSTNNQSICVCPVNAFGPRCSLISTCPINACQNDGRCVPADVSIPGNKYSCICPEHFFGQKCEYRKAKLDVLLDDIDIPAYLVAYFFTVSNEFEPIETSILRKLTLFQHIVTFYIAISFHLVIIQVNDKYYLAVLQQSPKADISTSISTNQECTPVERLLNDTVLNMISFQRIPYFHLLCQTNFDLTCFIDKDYLCLCTTDHRANCMKFNVRRDFQCPLDSYCTNGGQCLQDHPTCSLTKICLCPNCFFGSRCQFYAKGLGSTLDEILGYTFKRQTPLSKQPITVKVTAIMTMILFAIGVVNSILSIMTFSRKKSLQVGCGTYLLASSITSLCVMILFTLKFWLLFLAHQNYYDRKSIWGGNCYVEPLIKMFLYLDNWLNACVAIERAISVIQGISFNRRSSKRRVIWILIFLIITIVCLFIPQLMNLYIFYDESEERNWCVIRYVAWIESYSTILIFIHYFAPLAINLFAIACVIGITTRQRTVSQANSTSWIHFRSMLRKYRYVLISCVINVCLTVPHLIISIILDCKKSSNLLWFYLTGYFLSFFPAAFVFIIYVLPSSHYRNEFHELMGYIRRRFHVLRINFSGL